ncbi:MAG TPA: putative sulfate exporter family transporter [Candidatus Bathyarchaeota archaeon]|nr:putative sulfate exporter family transporter [Candidatus Bathyarchaeota archaeon]
MGAEVDWSSLWRKEDWWAVWLGFLLLGLTVSRVVSWLPPIRKWSYDLGAAVELAHLPYFVLLALGLLALTGLAVAFMKREDLRTYWAGFLVVFALAFVGMILASHQTIHYYGLEYVLWALVLGLLISNTVGVPEWLKPAVRAELYIKIGLVLLGAEILFQTIIKAGAFGVVQALVVVCVVWLFCYYLALKMGIGRSLASVMASGVSICGVSASIATGGAIKAKPKEVSYVVSLVLLVAIPMLVGEPFIAKAVGMPDAVAGAWIGGTIDTTPAVVAAGALYSERAMTVAAIVKMAQNTLIGVAAFVLAVYWVLRVERKPGEKPSPLEIWYRMPKFVVGFILASLLFSFVLTPALGEATVKATLKVSKMFRKWLFALAFVCIGLDTKFKELVKVGGGRPLVVFIVAQLFNILLTLALAYLLFGGILFPSPV